MSPHATRYSWLTFRLRTVFLFMTVSALILGVFVIPRETRRQARNALIARGINVDLEDDPNDPLPYRMNYMEPVPQPFWIRWWYGALPSAYTRSVRWVKSNKKQSYSQVDLQNIARLGRIHWLDIRQSIDNPQWLEPLIQADSIVGAIHFWGCDVDSDILKQIGKLRNVKMLSFEDVPLNAERFSNISEMKQLVSLTFRRTGCGNDALGYVASFPQLRRIELKEASVTDAGLRQLAKLSLLERFYVEVNAGDEGFVCLENMSNLVDLQIENTPVTDRSLVHLAAATGLRRLTLHSSKIDGSGLHHLRCCKQLSYLDFMGSPIHTGLHSLVELPKLHFVNLSQTLITDDALFPLGGSKSLVSLSLFDTQITDSGLQMLESILTLDNAQTNQSEAFRWLKEGPLRIRSRN